MGFCGLGVVYSRFGEVLAPMVLSKTWRFLLLIMQLRVSSTHALAIILFIVFERDGVEIHY